MHILREGSNCRQSIQTQNWSAARSISSIQMQLWQRAAFSDKTRLRILAALVSTELCVCDIASLLNMSQSAISHQLRFLKQARLVKSRKNGKTVYYALCDDHIQTILAQGIAHVQEG